MFFGISHILRVLDESPPVINLDGQPIENINDFKYLRVILDRKLSFSSHVEYMIKQGISRLKMLGKSYKFVDENKSLLLRSSKTVP